MSSLPRSRNQAGPAFVAIAGVLAGFLYGSALLSLLFLVPVQVVFGRKGFKEGVVAAFVALVAAFVAQAVPLFASGAGLRLWSVVALASLPPAVALAGIVVANAPVWKKSAREFSVLAGACLVSLAAIPGVIAIQRDGELLAQLEATLSGILDAFVAQAGGGPEAEAIKAGINVKTFAQTSIMLLECGFSAFILMWMGGTKWLGNRISGTGSLGRQEAIPLSEYRLPYLLVWPFMTAWAGVLGTSYFHVELPWMAVAWNLALVLSLLYAVQGLGIASHLMRRWNLPKGLRVSLAMMVALLAVTPPAGPAIAGLVPLLGVTETWIPYRNPKGVTA